MATNKISQEARSEVLVMYRECLHNHAATTTPMAYIVDGCGLFEASGPNGMPQAHQQTSTRRARIPAPTGRQEMNRQFQMPEGPVQEASARHTVETEATVRRRRITCGQSERMRVIAESNGWKLFLEYSREEVNRICV
ncbi:hypothetical protein Salat_0167800 [Sesamum alatum]|uniref:ZF-HD dimerization-type domain-containing protein n=1 Tax=Sesamum alatum TaxID=300844 RepID=A0AAE2CXS1_9LAMI|nr:hypothetical protein Salat_0167800 [Sesamum alatum]